MDSRANHPAFISDHHDGFGLAESLTISQNAPGPGGASHLYAVRAEGVGEDPAAGVEVARVQYQSGQRGADGSTPGVVDGVLLAITLDRLRAFQAGPYNCKENACAITHLEEALMWMQQRARNRAKRGVLGAMKK